jgi:uncharacterized damage-inducible protein DinB
MKTSPDFTTLPEFYKNYVSHVQDLNMLDALSSSIAKTVGLLQPIDEAMGEYRYAPGKWSVKELLCHIMDAERIFAYRALRFSRNDATPLSGFEENDYAPQANAHSRSLQQLLLEMKNLRTTSIDLFSAMTPEMLQRKGTANNKLISVVNIGYIIAGHETHHRNILTDRYLKK